MKQLVTISLSIGFGFVLAILVLEFRPVANGGPAVNCATKNGDVNADGKLDLTDAITILGNLFLGSPTDLAPICTPAGAPKGLPATGQTSCYNFDQNQGIWVEAHCLEADCTGQDGSFSLGCPMDGRFIDNNDGTVTDTCTGLMWQKDTADVSESFADTLAWCDALSYCEGLNFAGNSDWRLPNVHELQSIVDYGRFGPSIDPVFNALPEFYWTSTTDADTPDNGWGIGFNVGYVGVRVKTGDPDFSFNYVRAVRGP